ncbi:hypothetical protein GJAV_G00164500 [Gymnothorax javanicus]|nr:hypothetical protein GJAV_G00164500 [Gymnothorax javanicus]
MRSSNLTLKSKSVPGFLAFWVINKTISTADRPDWLYTGLPGKGRMENQQLWALKDHDLRNRATLHINEKRTIFKMSYIFTGKNATKLLFMCFFSLQ